MRARALAALLALALLVGWGGPDDHSDPAAVSTPRHVSAALAQGNVVAPTAKGATRGSAARRTQITPVPGVSGGVHPRVDCDRARCVALTYDDGPGLPTPRLLDILKRKHARATFFLVGQMVQLRPATARRIARGPHAIGVHTWDHSDLTTLSTEQIRNQLVRTMRIIHRATGVTPVLSRPPYGATNRRVRRVERQLGLAEILWDVDTADWLHRDPASVIARALSGVRRNSIILMHDIRPTTVDAAGPLIRALRRRGFRLVTVPELLGQTIPGHSYYRPGQRVIR
jgi:peptidoglycan/xylan/chitin deacetylase (PgdA/CDA1 family)